MLGNALIKNAQYIFLFIFLQLIKIQLLFVYASSGLLTNMNRHILFLFLLCNVEQI